MDDFRTRVVALTYHDVVDEADHDSSGFPGRGPATYKLGRASFLAHVEAIKDAIGKRKPHTVHDLITPVRSDPSVLLLTFDDGGATAPYVADVLEREGWLASFFIPTDFVGSHGFMSSTDIRDLHSRGHYIGSHSASHPASIWSASSDEIKYQWTRSRSALSDLLGVDVVGGSVPGGFYSAAVGRAAAAAGLQILMTSEPTLDVSEIDGMRVVGRFSIKRHTEPSTAARLSTGDPTAVAWQRLTWNSKKLAKRALGKIWFRARKIAFR